MQAWPALDDDDGLAQALDAVYEGMRLEPEHPSVALLTFVAATEGFGKRFVPDAPCDCIPGCKHEKGVAQKRFRKALKTVMTNREVEQVARIAYDYRSSTGHEGALFGSEHTFGYSHHPSFFNMPPTPYSTTRSSVGSATPAGKSSCRPWAGQASRN